MSVSNVVLKNPFVGVQAAAGTLVIVMDVRPEKLNASLSMLVTLFGMVMDVRAVQL
jgi:hypothetical protein